MKFRKIILLLFCLIVQSTVLFAQGDICDFNDPDNTTPCPLDTWVIILAFITVIFAAVHLHRNKKSLAA